MELYEKLAAPFPPERVSWRVGSTTADKSSGLALAFIDARDVYERLDAVVGVGGWQCRYPHADKKTVCEIGIKIGDEWVWKANGAGDSDIEAEKGALSDAVKRAAVVWGIGRYLYDLESPWVKLVAKGKSHFIDPSEKPRLHAILAGKKPAAPTAEQKEDKAKQFLDALTSWLEKHPREEHAAHVMANIDAINACMKYESLKGRAADYLALVDETQGK